MNVACFGIARRFGEKQNTEKAKVREDRIERDIEPALDEEERCQEREGDDAEPLLLFAV